ncbi:hypothetical protein D3C71_2161880 [compost metagenome]
MPLVAITSVQLTTPMRTVWHDAGSAAIAPALNRVVPQRIDRQRLNSLFIGKVSCGSGLL